MQIFFKCPYISRDWKAGCMLQIKTGIYMTENFALNLLYIHVLVLAENVFCVNWINTNVYNCLLYSDIQFSRKLTANFVLCYMQDPQFSRKLTANFVLCNIQGPSFSSKLMARFVLCNMQGPSFSHRLTAKFVLCNMQDPQFSRKLTAKFVLCNI